MTLGRALFRRTLSSLGAMARLPAYCPLGIVDHRPWLETSNKIEAFSAFQFADQLAGRDVECLPLAGLIRRVSALDPYTAAWASEGVAYFHAARALRKTPSPRDLLSESLPEARLVPLHSGTGMALAAGVLTGTSPLDEKVTRLDTLYRLNSRAGYESVMREAFGLAVRTLYPEAVRPITLLLPKDWTAYFWHGLGRGLYFAPTNLPPNGDPLSRLVDILQDECPNELALRNAIAGLAWAFTLVNIRHPELLESIVERTRGIFPHADSFLDGYRSSRDIWNQITGSAPQQIVPGALFRYREAKGL